jgi:hypothetical protein
LSYNASVVKIYGAINSMAHFYSKNYFSPTKKRSSLLQRWRCRSKVVGLAPGRKTSSS